MQSWLNVFTTREWAALSWIGIGLLWVFAHSDLRRSFVQVLRALLRPILISSFLASGAYVCACVWLLRSYGFWTRDNLKTTAVWAITYAFVTMFQLQKLQDAGFYRKQIRDAFSVTVLVVFMTQLYTFPFLVEFVVLPILALFTAVWAFSKQDETYKPATVSSGWLIGLIGTSFFLYSVYRTFNDPHSLFNLNNGRDLAVPAALTVLYMPFIYVFGIWSQYNRVFSILSIWLPDRGLRIFAKRQAIIRFRSDVQTLDRWRQFVLVSRPETREAVLQTIVEAWAMRSRDKYPVEVPVTKGWEPVRASQLLADYHLATLDYKPVFEQQWSASSPLLKIGSGEGSAVWQNNLGYYVNGTQFAATELALELNVNVFADKQSAEDQFIWVGMALVESAVSEDAVELLKGNLSALRPFSRRIEDTTVILEKQDWHGGAIEDGYNWSLSLTRANGKDSPSSETNPA